MNKGRGCKLIKTEINEKFKKKIIHSILSDFKKGEISKSDLNEYLSKIKDFFDQDDMAIIGISCELPDAGDHVQFWNNIMTEKESIKSFPDKRKEDYQKVIEINEVANKGGYLDEIDQFDADYFKIPPKVAEQMDPYHRKILEVIVSCIEDAGYYKEQLSNSKTGVFIGHDHTHRFMNSYFDFLSVLDLSSIMGSWAGMLASRISHLFNLKGPAIVSDSGCSSAMVAIDAAINSIRNGDCEAALVGGINLFLAPHNTLDSSVQSADYCFKAFDSQANGTIWSEGIASIYIKPLSKAVADKDHIYGVIKGVALNNDGKTGSLLALNANAQKEVILNAWEKAGISVEDISYIETHGTATILGDPLEVKALTEAFRTHTDKKQFCGIGSVKSNIGHTIGASGIAALIKILMSFKHGIIPLTINFREPNPYIDFLNSPLYVQKDSLKWTDFTKETIMGINSFSFTGTNAHLVVKSYSSEQRIKNDFSELIFPISAKNNKLMIRTIERIQKFLAVGDYQVEDVSYTMSCCRKPQDFRAVIITNNLENLDRALTDLKIMTCKDKRDILGSSDDPYRIYYDCHNYEFIGHSIKELDSLALKYMKKEALDFYPLFEGMSVFKCSLPPSEFDRKRFWDTPVKKKVSYSESSNISDEKEMKYSTNIDELLYNVWSEVLGYECIKPEDNFFELGGDSISGFKIVSYLSEALQLDIPSMGILNHPNFTDYSDYIRRLHQLNDEANLEETTKIEVASEDSSFPLISSQRGIYLTSQMMGDSIDDNFIGIMPNDKQYTFEHIVDAIHQLTKRHDVLRASFSLQDGIPIQTINHEAKVNVETFHVNSEENSVEQVLKNKIAEISCPFNLENPPLLRVYDIIINTMHHFTVFDIHHLIADGTSMGILIREFNELIEGRTLSEKNYNYPQVMRKIYQKEENALKTHLNWWLNKFEVDVPVLNIATDRPRPLVPSYSGFRVKSKIDKSLLASVKAFAAKTECTLYMTLLGALYQLICKLTNETDHVIGTLSANRTSPEEWNTVGMFVNTLPLRIDLDQNMTISNNFHQLKQLIVDYFSHHEISYELLLEEIEVQRSTGRNPFFDIYFSLENVEMGIDQDEELIEPDVVSSKFDIMVGAREVTDGLVIDWDCRSDLFDIKTIEKIASRYLVILENMVDNVESKILELDCLLEEEETMILSKFNATFNEYPREKTIVQLFEEQVEKTPDHIAVIFEEESITYKELNERVNVLAHHLRGLGVRSDDYVAIMAERSIEMIVGIYGVIKAGGAYVPIDSSHPSERIQFILEDCSPKVILAYKNEVETRTPIIDLEDFEIWEGVSENPSYANTPDDLIYCIYTSGTTGKPKGVLIEHRNAVNLRQSYINDIGLSEKDVVMQYASICFDQSVGDILVSLTIGAILCVVPDEIRVDPQAIEIYMNKYDVTFTSLTPKVLQELSPITLSSLKALDCGGEAGNLDELKKWSSHCRVFNTYGPTEGTVNASIMEVHSETEKLSIGRPISNAQIYIMSNDRLCGVGMQGELCILGDGLARGYLNRPELTKEKFVDNPYGDGKLYRTGDLARWLPDGNIEYLGRIDDQVKIRGYRIELGEIESAIRQIETIVDAVAIVKEDGNNENAIYAYFIAQEALEVSVIQDEIRQKLPAYMIPSYIKQIDKIPITSNGKLDRKALPDIKVKSEENYVAPRNEIEETLCLTFKEILDIDEVSVIDNFFELGGHSLKAMKLVNRIEAEAGKRVSLKEVMKHPTVEKLAELITGKKADVYVPIPIVEKKAYYPMSSVQKRMYILNQFDKKSITYNMPQGLKLTGDVNVLNLEKALETLMHRHEILRTTFMTVEEELVQKVNEAMPLDFEIMEDTKTSEEELMNDFIQPFDLNVGPLLRMKIIKRKGEYLLLIDMHHIISDGMSMDIFTNELMALYHGDNFDSLTHQYRDYSEWLRERDLNDQKDYWLSQFEEEAPILNMPLDYPRPTEQSFKGAMIFENIGEDLTKQIKQFAQTNQATEYMVFLSAVMILLGKYSNQEDIVIGSPISGRTHQDTENMLGMFVNTLAMRGRPVGEKRYEEFLEEIKETCFKAYENQEYPFEDLIEEVIQHRDMSRNPLFDVMIVMQNNENVELQLKEVRLESMELDFTISKFDFTFHIYEADQGYQIALEYCTDLYKEESVKRLISHLSHMLKQMIGDSSLKLNEVEVITEKEQSMIMTQFNDTYRKYPREKTIIQLFEKQVEKIPDHIAVIFEEESLTYKELNVRANALAQHLRRLGVKPDDYVAIMAEKSIEMMIGICGILKSGSVYVPLDPTYPKERITYILEDCKPKALLIGRRK